MCVDDGDLCVQILGIARKPSEIQGHILYTFDFESCKKIVGTAQRPAGQDEGSWNASMVGSETVSITVAAVSVVT